MTPDEKRAHLRLHGCEATRHLAIAHSEYGWRIYRLPFTHAARCLSARPFQNEWQIGGLTTADRYSNDNLDTLPDALLELLAMDRIEQFLSN